VKRVGFLVVLVALAATVPLASPASADPKPDVTRVTAVAPAMNPGQTAWVSVAWSARTPISNFAVTARASDGVTVGYPAGRAFSSLYGSASLAGGTSDFTSFRVTVPWSASQSVALDLHVTWDPGKGSKANDTSGKRSMDTTFSIPLVPYVGPDLSQQTEAVTVSQATPSWVDLSFRGRAPSLHDFELTVSGPGELVIGYPGDRRSTSLAAASTLLAGATDTAAVRLDASALTPGTYELELTETYTTSAPRQTTGKVQLVVRP
jgi:hypothetical protein